MEGTALFSKEDIRAVFHGAQLRLTKDGEQTAWQLANILGFGGLRLVTTLATIAQRYARVQSRDISGQDFWNALTDTRTVKEVELIRSKAGVAA